MIHDNPEIQKKVLDEMTNQLLDNACMAHFDSVVWRMAHKIYTGEASLDFDEIETDFGTFKVVDNKIDGHSDT